MSARFKTWFTVLSLAMSAVGLFGYYSSVIVASDIYRFGGFIGLFCAAPMIGFTFYYNKETKTSILSKIGMFIVVFMIWGVWTPFTMAKGLPSLLHHMHNQSSVQEFVVVSKIKSSSRLGCRNSVYFQKEFGQPLNDRICVSSDVLYQRILRGDKVIATGSRSPFGFSPNKIELLNTLSEVK